MQVSSAQQASCKQRTVGGSKQLILGSVWTRLTHNNDSCGDQPAASAASAAAIAAALRVASRPPPAPPGGSAPPVRRTKSAALQCLGNRPRAYASGHRSTAGALVQW